MSVNTAGGVIIWIGTTVTCTTLVQYEADTYTDIGEVEDGGQVGDESAAITFASLQDSRLRKFKGPKDAGTMAIVCGADSLDAGQLALAAAEGTKLNYNFKVSLADQRTISGQPTYLYFSAMVMGDRRNIGNVSNIIKRTYNLGVNTAILETAPS